MLFHVTEEVFSIMLQYGNQKSDSYLQSTGNDVMYRKLRNIIVVNAKRMKLKMSCFTMKFDTIIYCY